MNIKEAKDQVRQAVTAYRMRDEFGRLRIPMKRQRPVFLVGPPGIGKTEIVEQIAREMGIGLVSYSITHHTRQSALGLPYIAEKEYDGRVVRVSEYTMSEIIGSIYRKMEETGAKEGILFLDEINCVSETLTPAMLQFLQYKVFGQHQVPDGWVVVTAGNPAEYNASVHEFDLVTQDRLKRIDIEPDYAVWEAWAANESVHPCILAYLRIRREDFYHVENTVEGRRLVTPRAWVDLSDMMRLYEENGMEVNELLIRQYLQDDEISGQFAVYWALWKKYRKDYRLTDILEGNYDEKDIARAARAPFDEQTSVIGLLLDGVITPMREVLRLRRLLVKAKKLIEKAELEAELDALDSEKAAGEILTKILDQKIREMEEKTGKEQLEFLPEAETDDALMLLQYLKKNRRNLKTAYRGDLSKLKAQSARTNAMLKNLFAYVVAAYGEDAQLMMAMTELTAREVSAKYIAQYGSEEYFRYNKKLLFYERDKAVIKEIDTVL